MFQAATLPTLYMCGMKVGVVGLHHPDFDARPLHRLHSSAAQVPCNDGFVKSSIFTICSTSFRSGCLPCHLAICAMLGKSPSSNYTYRLWSAKYHVMRMRGFAMGETKHLHIRGSLVKMCYCRQSGHPPCLRQKALYPAGPRQIAVAVKQRRRQQEWQGQRW